MELADVLQMPWLETQQARGLWITRGIRNNGFTRRVHRQQQNQHQTFKRHGWVNTRPSMAGNSAQPTAELTEVISQEGMGTKSLHGLTWTWKHCPFEQLESSCLSASWITECWPTCKETSIYCWEKKKLKTRDPEIPTNKQGESERVSVMYKSKFLCHIPQ